MHCQLIEGVLASNSKGISKIEKQHNPPEPICSKSNPFLCHLQAHVSPVAQKFSQGRIQSVDTGICNILTWIQPVVE